MKIVDKSPLFIARAAETKTPPSKNVFGVSRAAIVAYRVLKIFYPPIGFPPLLPKAAASVGIGTAVLAELTPFDIARRTVPAMLLSLASLSAP